MDTTATNREEATTRNHIVLAPTYAGAALAFVAFIFLGAVPGVLYGGYMAMVVFNVLFGAAGDGSLLGRLVVGTGMGLGLAAALFFFLVAGAVVGTLAGLPFAPMLRRMSERAAAAEADEVVHSR